MLEIRIEGLDILSNALNGVSERVKEHVTKANATAGRKVQADAQLLAPVALKDGGTLRNSIKSRPTATGFEVYSNVEYSVYVEFGTGQRGAGSPQPPGMDLNFRADWAGMKPIPYMYPAYIQNKQWLKDFYTKAVQEALKAGGK